MDTNNEDNKKIESTVKTRKQHKVQEVSERVNETKQEIERLKSELQKLIDTNLKQDKNEEKKEKVSTVNLENIPVKLERPKPESPLSKRKSNITSTTISTREPSPKRVKHYDQQQARDFIKKQKELRKNKLKEQQCVLNQQDLRKQRLKDLHQKSIKLVTENVKKSARKTNPDTQRSRSASRDANYRLNKDVTNQNTCRRSRSVSRELNINIQNNTAQIKVLKPQNTQNKIKESPKKAQNKIGDNKNAQKQTLNKTIQVPEQNLVEKILPELKITQKLDKSIQSEIPTQKQVPSDKPTQKLSPSDKSSHISSQVAQKTSREPIVALENYFLVCERIKAATIIQSAYRGYKQRKKYKLALKVHRQLKHNPTFENIEKKTPSWLEPATSLPYPYNFISAVKKKLNIATGNLNDHPKNTEVQRIVSPKLEEFKSYVSHRREEIHHPLIVPSVNLSKKSLSNKISEKSDKSFTSDSDSDTTRNIPEISEESAPKNKNINFDRRIDYNNLDLTKNINFERSAFDEKIRSLSPPDIHFERKNRDSKYPSDIDSILSHYSKSSKTQKYSDNFNSNLSSKDSREILTDSEIKTVSNELKNILSRISRSHTELKSDSTRYRDLTNEKKTQKNVDSTQKIKTENIDSKKYIDLKNSLGSKISELKLDSKIESETSPRSSKIDTNRSNFELESVGSKLDSIQKSLSTTKGSKLDSMRSNFELESLASNIEESVQKSLISSTVKGSKLNSTRSNFELESLASNIEESAQKSLIGSTTKRSKLDSKRSNFDLNLDSILDTPRSNGSKKTNSEIETIFEGSKTKSVSELPSARSISSKESLKFSESESISTRPSTRESEIHTVRSENLSARSSKEDKNNEDIPGLVKPAATLRARQTLRTIPDVNNKNEEPKRNPNQIHLKFEAELHLLNSFNSSLQQVVAVEKSLLGFENKENITQETKGSQTTLETPRKEFSKVNFQRGCDELDIGLENTNGTINLSNLELQTLKNSFDTTVNSLVSRVPEESLIVKNNPYVGISLDMFDKMIKDEDARIEHLKAILKLREKSLFDRTKGELAWLEIQKKQLRESGHIDEISNVKKKQRGLIIKLQQERHEMQRLKQAHKTASKERKMALNEQRNLMKLQLQSTDIPTRIKRTPRSDKRQSGPIKVYSIHTKTEHTKELSKHRVEEYMSITSSSVVSRISEDSDTEAKDLVTTTNMDKVKRSLLIREEALQKRRKEAEELLQWHKRLKEEEMKIAQLEEAAKSISKSIPEQPKIISGAQLNRFWKNITGSNTKKFDERKKFSMSQKELEQFFLDARKIFREVSDENESKRKSSFTDYVSDFEIASSIRTLDNVLDSVSSIVYEESGSDRSNKTRLSTNRESEINLSKNEKDNYSIIEQYSQQTEIKSVNIPNSAQKSDVTLSEIPQTESDISEKIQKSDSQASIISETKKSPISEVQNASEIPTISKSVSDVLSERRSELLSGYQSDIRSEISKSESIHDLKSVDDVSKCKSELSDYRSDSDVRSEISEKKSEKYDDLISTVVSEHKSELSSYRSESDIQSEVSENKSEIKYVKSTDVLECKSDLSSHRSDSDVQSEISEKISERKDEFKLIAGVLDHKSELSGYRSDSDIRSEISEKISGRKDFKSSVSECKSELTGYRSDFDVRTEISEEKKSDEIPVTSRISVKTSDDSVSPKDISLIPKERTLSDLNKSISENLIRIIKAEIGEITGNKSTEKLVSEINDIRETDRKSTLSEILEIGGSDINSHSGITDRESSMEKSRKSTLSDIQEIGELERISQSDIQESILEALESEISDISERSEKSVKSPFSDIKDSIREISEKLHTSTKSEKISDTKTSEKISNTFVSEIISDTKESDKQITPEIASDINASAEISSESDQKIPSEIKSLISDIKELSAKLDSKTKSEQLSELNEKSEISEDSDTQYKQIISEIKSENIVSDKKSISQITVKTSENLSEDEVSESEKDTYSLNTESSKSDDSKTEKCFEIRNVEIKISQPLPLEINVNITNNSSESDEERSISEEIKGKTNSNILIDSEKIKLQSDLNRSVFEINKLNTSKTQIDDKSKISSNALDTTFDISSHNLSSEENSIKSQNSFGKKLSEAIASIENEISTIEETQNEDLSLDKREINGESCSTNGSIETTQKYSQNEIWTEQNSGSKETICDHQNSKESFEKTQKSEPKTEISNLVSEQISQKSTFDGSYKSSELAHIEQIKTETPKLSPTSQKSEYSYNSEFETDVESQKSDSKDPDLELNLKGLNSDSSSVSSNIDVLETVKESPESKSSSNRDECSYTGVSHIDVRKRVSEILADSSVSPSISRGDKSPRLQDFYVTTYDVMSPSPGSSPEIGSPTGDFDQKGKEEILRKNIYGNEAEELLRKQLEIEQEIKRLEQQQKESVPYCFMREIPNKPPPPYKPPVKLTPTITTVIPIELKQIKTYVNKASDILFTDYSHGKLSENSNPNIGNKINSYRFVFDLCKEIALDIQDKTKIDNTGPSWMQIKPRLRPLELNKKITKDSLESVMNRKVQQLLGFQLVNRRDNLIVRWSRKKRDHVDEILVSEAQTEENEWTNYDQDEITVKNNLTNEILDMLVDETVQIFSKILGKRNA